MTKEKLEELRGLHRNARRLTRLLNSTLETERDRQIELIRELFCELGGRSYVKPPFYCDFGCNTRIGEKFFSNYGCIFLDHQPITIGCHVMLGPKVSLAALDKPITVGDDVWIGGSSTVCPGVTIGSNVVIGAGSVVSSDIPDNVLAAGNPCRVIRPVTEADKIYWTERLEEYRNLCDQPKV